jgi:hypothetical protein
MVKVYARDCTGKWNFIAINKCWFASVICSKLASLRSHVFIFIYLSIYLFLHFTENSLLAFWIEAGTYLPGRMIPSHFWNQYVTNT